MSSICVRNRQVSEPSYLRRQKYSSAAGLRAGQSPRRLRTLTCHLPWLRKETLGLADSNVRAIGWCEAFLDALALAYGPSYHCVAVSQSPSRHVRAARRGVLRALRWIVRKDTVQIKEMTNWWRRKALGSNEPVPRGVPPLESLLCGVLHLRAYSEDHQSRILHQLSRLARAGPLPLESQVCKAYETHLKALTSAPRITRAVRNSVRRFVDTWCYRRSGGLKVRFPQSTSASFGMPAKVGGAVMEVQALVREFKQRRLTQELAFALIDVMKDLPYEVFDPWDRDTIIMSLSGLDESECSTVGEYYLFPYQEEYFFEGLGPQEWEYLTEHLYAYAACGLECAAMVERSREGIFPPIRQVAIRERGSKVRMVTPIPGALLYFSQVLNGLLLDLLKSDYRMDPSSSDPLEDCIHRMSGGDGLVIRSVDMKSASDLIPHPIALSLARGLSERLGLSPFLRSVFELAVGPHLIHTAVCQIPTNCGILMGSGVTWPLLSLYNLWLWETAWTRSGLRKVTDRSSRARLRIVGDDALAVVPDVVSDLYTRVLVETNGEPSEGKDLVSRTHGCLVEQLFVAHKEPRYLRTISVRSIQPHPRVGRGELNGEVIPPWALGSQLSRAIEPLGSPGWLIDYVNFRFREEILWLRRQGVPPHLPRTAGGGGFPTRSELRSIVASLRPKWARALRCAMSQGVEKGSASLSLLTSAWSLGGQNVLNKGERLFWSSAAAEALESMREAVVDSQTPGATPRCEAVELAFAVASSAARLVRRPPPGNRGLRIGSVKRMLTEGLEHLNALVPYPKLTDRPKDLWCGVTRFIGLMNEPVHPLALLPLTNMLSASIVGDIVASPRVKRKREVRVGTTLSRKRLRWASPRRKRVRDISPTSAATGSSKRQNMSQRGPLQP